MVVIFCGIPGSGKSTLAKLLVKKLKKLKKTSSLFVSDRVKGRVYQKILEFLKVNLSKVDFIVLDATFYKKKWREAIYNLVGRRQVLTCYLHCSIDTCIERNKKRKPRVPEKAVHIIAHEMEKPKRPDLSIDTEKIKPNQACSKILHLLKLKSE